MTPPGAGRSSPRPIYNPEKGAAMGIQFTATDPVRTFTHEGVAYPCRVDLGEDWECYGFNSWGASAFFALLGAAGRIGSRAPVFDPHFGSLTLPEARRLVMAARARFESVVPVVLRELYRAWEGLEPPFDTAEATDRLRLRLDSFAAYIEAAAAAGADRIEWA